MFGSSVRKKRGYSFSKCHDITNMGPKKNRKSEEILLYEEVKKWFDNNSRNSMESGRTRLNNLANFALTTNLDPLEMVQMTEPEFYKIVEEFIENEEKRGLLGSSISKKVDSVRSWVASQGMVLRPINIYRAKENPTISDMIVPNQEELRTLIITAGSLRTKNIIYFVAHSGLRFCTLGRDKGSKGLQLKDLPDLNLEGIPKFSSVPAFISVPVNLSKNRKKYPTFMSSEAVEHFEAYLLQRINDGEKLTPTSPVIPSGGKNEFLYPTKLGSLVKDVIRKVGYKMRPYDLRAFFATTLQIAEGRIGMSRSVVKAFMGHSGEVTARYGLGRGNLRAEIIEELRLSYQQCEPFLLTQSNRKLIDIKSQISDLIEKMKLGDVRTNSKDVQSNVRIKSEQIKNGPRERVFPIGRVADLLEHGYVFVSSLDEQNVVLRLPEDRLVS